MMERLQKFLAHAGVAARRTCEELIAAGKVKVNGQVVREMGTKVDPANDVVEVAGKRIEAKEEKVYVLLNKPQGYVTTLRDPQGRPKVVDLLREVDCRVYPVGRLDFDTEGLLLLTNDGEVTYTLTHPKHVIGKTYIATVKGIPDQDKLKRFQKGLRLADGPTAPAKVKLLKKQGGNAVLEITIYEGRNRQVRRMCETIGHPVLTLKRVAMGFLTLEGLETGKWRMLTKNEIRKLQELINNPDGALGKAAGEAPGRKPGGTLGKTRGGTPDRTAKRRPGRASGNSPGELPTRPAGSRTRTIKK